MAHDKTGEDDWSGQWESIACRWATPSSEVAMASDGPRVALLPAAGRRKPRRDTKVTMPLAIRVDSAIVDHRCRETLRKLVGAGCTQANTPYSLEQFQVSEQELLHLKDHGLVHAAASALLQPIIQSCERQKAGADVGKITVILNVNLS